MKFTGFVIVRNVFGVPTGKVPVYKRIHRHPVR